MQAHSEDLGNVREAIRLGKSLRTDAQRRLSVLNRLIARHESLMKRAAKNGHRRRAKLSNLAAKRRSWGAHL
jgi:hypothetical protein